MRFLFFVTNFGSGKYRVGVDYSYDVYLTSSDINITNLFSKLTNPGFLIFVSYLSEIKTQQ